MAKRYFEPRWFSDNMRSGISYWPGGEGEPGTQYDHKKCTFIPMSALHTLLPFLFNNGYLNTFLTTTSREDDLKVSHRLLDVIEKQLNQSSSPEIKIKDGL